MAIPGSSGISMKQSYNTKNIIEDFMKAEYVEGLRNEFNQMEALINRLPKDTISGKKKYKTFALGITDNVRALGSSNDTYQLDFGDFLNKGRETAEAEFDTTKLMANFSITDEAILKGTGDGSLIDVLKDSFTSMETNIKVTMQRYTYGASDGKIGQVMMKGTVGTTVESPKIVTYTMGAADSYNYPNSTKPKYDAPNTNYYSDRPLPLMIQLTMCNSGCLLPGMGILILDKAKNFIMSGTIFQKKTSQIYQEDLIVFVDKTLTSFANVEGAGVIDEAVVHTPIKATAESLTAAVDYMIKCLTYDVATADADQFAKADAVVYARQFNEAAQTIVNAEYHGLEEIIMTQDNYLFGIDRKLYSGLNCTVHDCNGGYLGEELLRDMSDHLATTMPDGSSINLVCAQHRVISTVEKSLYQFKQYNMDASANSVNLGTRKDIVFDNYVLVKDKYAREARVSTDPTKNLKYCYMIDQNQIGELVRRDFQWITSGEVNSVLQRVHGSEVYEAIMNKYADMYLDAWKCHGAFKGIAVPTIGASIGTGYAAIA